MNDLLSDLSGAKIFDSFGVNRDPRIFKIEPGNFRFGIGIDKINRNERNRNRRLKKIPIVFVLVDKSLPAAFVSDAVSPFNGGFNGAEPGFDFLFLRTGMGRFRYADFILVLKIHFDSLGW